MKDQWELGDSYEYFMGRWSRLVSQLFVERLAPSPNRKWLDVGCGTGALSATVLDKASPAELVAVDSSAGFVKSLQQKLGSSARCEVGNAMDLPFADNAFDYVVSGLVLNFIPDPQQALREMKRVSSPGGTVAVYVWDYAGKMEFLRYFWDAVRTLDPSAAALHEGTRFPHSNEAGLQAMFKAAGLVNSTVEPLEIDTNFTSFDDYWKPFLGGQGPAPTYVLSLNDERRGTLRDYLRDHLPIRDDDGSIPMTARAWAVKCTL